MSSRGGTLHGLALGLALTLPIAIGCGHKENPKPPPQKIPQPIRDLVVAQRGGELRFSFGYPQTTISGLPIDDIVAIELWEFEVAVPEAAPPAGDEVAADVEGEGEGEAAAGAAADDEVAEEAGGEDEAGEREPEAGAPEAEAAAATMDDEDEEDEDDVPVPPVGTKESRLEIDPREFESAAKRRLRLEGQELTNAISGDRVELTVTLDRIDPAENVGLVYGVRSFQTLERPSNFSNLSKIVPRRTPDPPAELELEPVKNGVKISWTYEGDEPKEFRFYRRDALAPAFDRHLGTQSGDADQFLDSSAEFGATYTYAMTLVVNQTPLVESALTPEREIEYLDAFAPEAPIDLVVLSEAGTARLLWEGSSDRDLAGYVVFRRAGTGEFERLNERPVREAEYSDTNAASGRTYAYRVVAVDQEGNMSEPSEEVEVRIP